jgi:hypothetical protein
MSNKLTHAQTIRFIGTLLAVAGGAFAARLFVDYSDWRIIVAVVLMGSAGIIIGADDTQ